MRHAQMDRKVAPELLDGLPADHASAIHSRNDLVRLNRWMGNVRWMSRALNATFPSARPKRLADIGAGDGRFALLLAAALPDTWRGTALVLVDRQASANREVLQGLHGLGWHSTTVREDVFHWLRGPQEPLCTAITANLFLHHFTGTQLRQLLEGIAARAQAFVSIEPRRSFIAYCFSRLVGFIGCNHVTRHDAPVSVRAGFSGQELSAAWPREPGWKLCERPVGLFGHLFLARAITPS